MKIILLIAGIAMIVGGMVLLLYYAGREYARRREVERMPLRAQEQRSDYLRKRTYSRLLSIGGIMLIILYLIL